MSGYRPSFTTREENAILEYIVQHKAQHKLRGLTFWRELANSGLLPGRTYQSLHERFRKFIIVNIESKRYDVSLNERLKIRDVYNDTAQQRKRREAYSEQQEAPPLPVNIMTMSDSRDSGESTDDDLPLPRNKNRPVKRDQRVPVMNDDLPSYLLD